MENLYNWTVNGPWDYEDERTDTEWKTKIENKTLYISFRGTTSKLDWLQNFSFWIKPYKNQKVKWYAHAGFTKKWKAVRDHVRKVVEDSKATTIIVSGFSQGGAVATLCYEDLTYNYPNLNVNGEIYGSPRVVWLWNFNKIKKRFTNLHRNEIKEDVVPNVPFNIMGYFHVGNKTVKKIKIFPWPWKWEEIHMSYAKFF